MTNKKNLRIEMNSGLGLKIPMQNIGRIIMPPLDERKRRFP